MNSAQPEFDEDNRDIDAPYKPGPLIVCPDEVDPTKARWIDIWRGTNARLFEAKEAEEAAKRAARRKPEDWMPRSASNDNRKGSAKRERFEVTFFDDLEEETPKVEILEGVLGEGEFTDVIGKPGSGKSVIVTDMACHIAAGMPWHGRAVRKGLVVYFAAERRKLTLRRMAAFRKHHSVSGLPLAVFGGKLDMTANILDAAALSQAVRSVEERFGVPCVWVIIDTLSRTFGGGDQNASKDMGKYVQSIDEIIRTLNCHVTVVHHSGWGEERGKGAIDLDGAVDTSFYVKNSGGNFTLVCDGTNDGEPGPVAAFKMQSVEVGPGTNAPVVIPQKLGNLSGVTREVEPAKPMQREIALGHLQEAIDVEGVHPPDPEFSDGAVVVKEEVWRERCYAAAGDATPDAKRKSFQRAKAALLGGNLIRESGQWVWPS